MYHGTLTQIYGLDIALEAFGRARPKMPGAEFWILGKGPEQARLMEQAQRLGLNGSVKFLGTVPPEKIPGWLSQCDAGVLATRRDVFLDYSFSNKLSEYVVMGKPVISSRLKTIASYFSDQALAYFEPNNAEQLAREMVRVYGDAALRTRLARQAAQEYAPISWGVMKERYLAMMAELLGGSARPQIAEPPATTVGAV
jgi:glycosyltransferase involved in cell wall biosynthesis